MSKVWSVKCHAAQASGPVKAPAALWLTPILLGHTSLPEGGGSGQVSQMVAFREWRPGSQPWRCHLLTADFGQMINLAFPSVCPVDEVFSWFLPANMEISALIISRGAR